ncbi:MAG: dienelactone hydrolase family protein [Candidatus Eremiobacteraeota bacterium]|nr:dienelactone hydrolase family protein [Candidatus Eremiobacteraeota bacterium]
MKNCKESKIAMKDIKPFLIFSVILLLVGIVGSLVFHVPMRTFPIQFQLPDGNYGYGKVYLPVKPPSSGKYSVVYLCPGIFTPNDFMDYIASELCQRGYAACSVLIPEWKPRKNLTVLRNAIRHVNKNFSEIDSKKIAAFGHSLGGTTAVDLAYNNESVVAVSSVGLYIGGELMAQPGNLLLGTGLHDNLNGPDKMRKSIESVTNGAVKKEGVFRGTFSTRTARYLFISPYSNHAAETVDPLVTQELLDWLSMSFHNKPEKNLSIKFPFYIVFNLILLAGVFMCSIPLYTFLLYEYESIINYIALIIMAACTILLAFAPVNPVFMVRLFGFTFLAAVISNYYMKKARGDFEKAVIEFIEFFGKMFLFVFILFIAFSISQFLFSLSILTKNTQYLLSFPGYILVSFILAPCKTAIGSIRFIKNMFPWVFAVVFVPIVLLFLIEIRKPGILVGFVSNIYAKLCDFLRFDKRKKIGSKKKIIFTILILLMIASWFYIYFSGLLTSLIIRQFSVFIFRYFIVPVILYVIFSKIISYKKITAKS